MVLKIPILDKNFRVKSKVRIKELYQNTTIMLGSQNMQTVKKEFPIIIL